MEPLSTAMTLATLVSLVGQFRSERSSEAGGEFDEFLAWLVETKHEQLKKSIESNSRTITGIKILLKEQFESLQNRLGALDDSLAAFASSFSGFSEIAFGVKPEAVLSEQALHILRQIDNSTVTKILKIETSGGTDLLCIDGDADFNISEPRFLDDDLARLVELGLMRIDYNSRGDPLYIFTRAASRLVRGIGVEQDASVK